MMLQTRSPQVAALTRVSLKRLQQPHFRTNVSQASTLARQRACLSKTWLPTGGLAQADKEDGHSKLVRAGYLRQSHPGVFHLLPLGLRVQEKLEKLIDKHMLSVGASKVALSSLSSQALWERTNRLDAYGPELFRLTDRKDVPLLLAPTHEEEIASLVSKLVTSYKNLPLRLYQIGRKYRDELRPRQGVLRSREFVMKDLYTFDASVEAALESYAEVRAAYSRLFDELKIPYVVAEASSGDIGGDLSHEYHLPSLMGEDMVISCNSCSYVANEELAVANTPSQEQSVGKARVWRGVSKDRTFLVNVWYPNLPGLSESDINTHAIKSVVPGLDSSIADSIAFWTQDSTPESASPKKVLKLVNVVDRRMSPSITESIKGGSHPQMFPAGSNLTVGSLKNEVISSNEGGQPVNALRIQDGDDCAHCESGKLKAEKAVELGHTFHLGTRYSKPLGANVQMRENVMAPLQMGCHGIGVSRIIGAVANHLADEKGLNWPRAIAPFEVVVIPGRGVEGEDANHVYDRLVDEQQQIDVVLDDRVESFPWKMKDADTVGHPVIVLLGRKWLSDRMCEVQCRRLKVKEDVAFDELSVYINNLLSLL